MSSPICQSCGKSGEGVLFPLFPHTSNKSFGEICKDCDEEEAHWENEYLSTGGECGVAHAEAVGSAIQAGFDSYDAKLYVRQQRPEERS